MREVFISYKTNNPVLGNNDETVANELCQAIEAAGISCWIAPRDIEPGVISYEGAIMRAIKDCKVMLLVFSKFSNDSDDIFKEVSNAARRRKTIIPFKIDDADPVDALEYHLGSVQWINASGNYHAMIPELIATLNRKLGKQEYGQTINVNVPMTDGTNPSENECCLDSDPIIKSATSIIESKSNKNKAINETNPGLKIKALETIVVKGVSFNMIGIEGGTFMMGGKSVYKAEPVHQVTLSSFYIGETPVTQQLWQVVMGDNPSHNNLDLQSPVDSVSWEDCQVFISCLNEMTGRHFRLPTEAEWEFAARGGNMGRGSKYAGSNNLDEVAWNINNTIISKKRKWYGKVVYTRSTFPVATKKANELGLFDMSGNVSEWCQDWFGKYSGDRQIDPTGPSSGSERVIRGGCYLSSLDCSVCYRSEWWPTSNCSWFGLRLAL